MWPPSGSIEMSDVVTPPYPDSVEVAEEASTWAAAYVHIPFCGQVCPYCDFAVVAGRDHDVERYVNAVVAEIRAEPPWRPLHAVYFGGGTPSRVDPNLLAMILTQLADSFGIEPGAEISLEANPEDWTGEKAAALRRAGLTRVSFGAQSFRESVLSALGRRHQPAQIDAAVAAARQAGFVSVNLDLIFGTPGESLQDWEETLAAALSTEPDHLSCYALTVEPGTSLHRQVRGGAAAPDPDLQADEFEAARLLLGAAGLAHYEVSNWARPGHHCRYNLAVWAQGEYLGFGMGAHRFRDGVRSHGLSRLDFYLTEVEAGRPVQRGRQIVAGWGMEVERVFLGLRRRAGVMAGLAGRAFMQSETGRRLDEAGVVGMAEERLLVRQPLLTDTVLRDLLALPAVDC